MVHVREERDEDSNAVAELLRAAFGGDVESALVEDLRAQGDLALTRVAERAGRVVGHVALSPARLKAHPQSPAGLGLAPVAVAPPHQGEGLGSALIVCALDAARSQGIPWVVVLGHPSYYPRFGFQRARDLGLHCRWNVPDEHFMALELRPGALDGMQGEVLYAPAFDAL